MAGDWPWGGGRGGRRDRRVSGALGAPFSACAHNLVNSAPAGIQVHVYYYFEFERSPHGTEFRVLFETFLSQPTQISLDASRVTTFLSNSQESRFLQTHDLEIESWSSFCTREPSCVSTLHFFFF